MATDERPNETRFRSNLVMAREAQGISQVELASRVGKSQQWVAKIETGGQTVKLEEAVALAEQLGLTLAELIDAAPQRTAAEWRDVLATLSKEHKQLEVEIEESREGLEYLIATQARCKAQIAEAARHLNRRSGREK